MSPSHLLVFVFCLLVCGHVSGAELKFHDVRRIWYHVGKNPRIHELTVSFVDTNIKLLTFQDLELQYNRTIGKWYCDYYFNLMSDAEVAYVTRCTTGDSKNEIVTVDGFITGKENNLYHLSYDLRRNMQQLVIQEKGGRDFRDSRSLIGDEIAMLQMRSTGSKDDDDVLSWSGSPFDDVPDNPMIELSVMMDKTVFEKFANKDRDEAEKLAHHLVHGTNAYYRKFNLTLRIKHFVIGDEELEDLIRGAQDLDEVMPKLTQYYSRFTTKSNVKYADVGPDIVRGIPDLVLTFTDKQHTEGPIGKAYTNAICSTSAHAILVMPKLAETDDPDPDLWIGTWIGDTFREARMQRPLLSRLRCGVIAHEVGHSLGLAHYEEPDCRSKTGVCPMADAAGIPSHIWSAHSTTKLTQRITRGKMVRDCLWRKDVFESTEDVRVPQDMFAVVEESGTGNHLILRLHTHFMPPFEVRLKFSLQFEGETRDCFYYRNQADTAFAAFERCTAPNTRWRGVFHANDIIVKLHATELISLHRLKSGTGGSPKTGRLSDPLEIRLMIGMHHSFISESGGIDKAFVLVSRAVNMADVSFRMIGIRIRMSAFHEFKNDSLLQAMDFAAKINRSENVFLVFAGSQTLSSNHTTFSPCSPDAVAVIPFDRMNDVRMGIRVTHAIGHQLGLEDEAEGTCGCKTPLGTCVMDENDLSRGFLWSTCSVNRLRRLESNSCIRHAILSPSAAVRALRLVVFMCFLVSILGVCYNMPHN